MIVLIIPTQNSTLSFTAKSVAVSVGFVVVGLLVGFVVVVVVRLLVGIVVVAVVCLLVAIEEPEVTKFTFA